MKMSSINPFALFDIFAYWPSISSIRKSISTNSIGILFLVSVALAVSTYINKNYWLTLEKRAWYFIGLILLSNRVLTHSAAFT